MLGHRLHLRLDEFRLQADKALDISHLRQLLCKLESTRDVALGITKDLVGQLLTAHGIGGKGASCS